MRKKISLLIGPAALALLALPVLAALPPEYANAPSQKDFPQADILVLSDTASYALLPDGRVEQRVRRVEKVLNYEGVDLAGDPKIAFDSKRQELKIIRSRTWAPSGAATDTKANGFNEMTPFALEKAPAYTDIRQMVVTRVAIEVGSVIELEYTLTDRVPWRRFLEGAEPIRGESPALLREVAVAVPRGKALKCAVQGGAGEPARTQADGRDVYTWTWKAVPALKEADTSPAERSFAPRLLFSTASGWGEQSASLASLVAKAVGTSSPEMAKKLEEVTKGATVDLERVVKIHGFVASAFRTIDWPLADFDFVPRPASEVFDSGYGHPLDKAVLLAAMLQKAGYEAAVGLAGYNPNAAGPCLASLGDVVVRVDYPGGYLGLYPCTKLSEGSQKDMVGIQVLPLKEGFDATHAIPGLGATDLLDIAIEAKAAEDLSLEGTAVLNLDGWYSPYWAVRGSDEELKGAVGGIISGVFPGSEVNSVSVVRMEPGGCAFKVTFKAKAPKPLGPVKALRVGSADASALSKVHGPHRSARDLPVLLSCPADERLSVKLTLPEKLKPRALPREIKIESGVARALQSSSFKDGALTVTRTLSVPKAFVPEPDWGDLRMVINTLAADPVRLAIF